MASSIKLRKDAYSMSAGRQTTLEDIYEIFLLIEQLRTTGALDENSDGICSERLIGVFVRGLHDLCRLKSEMVPLSMIDGLSSFMQAYRKFSDYHYAQIFLQDSTPGQYFDLLTRLQEIGGEAARAASYFIMDQEPQHWFSPTQYKTYRRYSSQYAIEPEHHTWLNVTRAVAVVPEYTLAVGDGTANAVYDGKISLLRNNQVIQTLQAIPDPTNHPNKRLSVNSGGTLEYDDPAPGTGDYNSLLASMVSLQTQVAVMSFQIAALQAALPRVRVSPGSTTTVPLRVLSFDSASLQNVYDTPTEHLHVWGHHHDTSGAVIWTTSDSPTIGSS